MGLRKHKANADIVNTGSDLFGCQCQRNTCGLQNVRATAKAGHFSIAMFGYLGTAAGSNESGCSGDIEELAAAAAGAASVDDYLAFTGTLVESLRM